MRYKRYMIILVLAVFALSVAGVCASDEATALESSSDDSIIEAADVQAIGENGNDEVISEGNAGTFSDLRQKIQDAGDDTTITLDRDYEADDSGRIDFSNSRLVIDGKGHKLDAKNKTVIFIVRGSNVTIKNITFTNAYGVAVYWYGVNGEVSNCKFINNTNGAIEWNAWGGNVSGCSFINNTAGCGGAVFWNDVNGCVSGCSFINNTADDDGGAIYWQGENGCVSGCSFVGNTADDDGDAIYANRYLPGEYCWFGNDAGNYRNSMPTYGAFYCDLRLFLNVTVNPNTLPDLTTSDVIFKLYLYNSSSGNVSEYDNAPFDYLNFTITATNGFTDKNSIKPGDELIYTATNKGIGTVTASIADARYTIELDNYILSPMLSVPSQEAYFTPNATIALNYSSGATGKVNITLKGRNGNNYTFANLDLNATVSLGAINIGEYDVNVTYSGDADFINATAIGTLKVNKCNTDLTASEITTTYNINRDLVITLTDANGNHLAGFNVTVDLNGAETYITDSNGQVKVSTKGLAPNTYTARISFNGDNNYVNSSADVKVTVNKATPKLTAKAKTFKSSVKTKKYTIVLKDNAGKAIKNAKVTLKVKGKTYKATTNSKGKATFKITKLNKKGTYKATITFKGDKNYKKVTKKAKIKVIITFKTVSKGSKDKSTVKEIQQALKDNGYYLTYKGHYLKIDGIYKGCTERSVKQFQKAKHLKVTGKVDEKTAQKLGLI